MLGPKRKGTIKIGIRSRVVALLLLGLFAHAVLLCAFHYHPAGGYDGSEPGPRIVSDCGRHSEHVPISKETSKCLSCRLQSNFLLDVRSPAWVFALAPETIVSEQAHQELRSYKTILVLSDRAPPLA